MFCFGCSSPVLCNAVYRGFAELEGRQRREAKLRNRTEKSNALFRASTTLLKQDSRSHKVLHTAALRKVKIVPRLFVDHDEKSMF